MVVVTIDIPKDLNREVEIFRAKNSYPNKRVAVVEILRKYLKENPQ